MNNEPAFPHTKMVGHKDYAGGMSLRDYFAAKALVGILSGPASREGVPMKEWFDIPEQAYRLADAMMAARTPQVSGPEISESPADRNTGEA